MEGMQTSKKSSLIGRNGSKPVQNNSTVTRVRFMEEEERNIWILHGGGGREKQKRSGVHNGINGEGKWWEWYLLSAFLHDDIAKVAPHGQMLTVEFLHEFRCLNGIK